MKNKLKYLVIIVILSLIVLEGLALAGTPNIDNLKKYNFDSNNEIEQNTSASKGVFTLFTYLLLFIIIAILAYFTTKWIAKVQSSTRVKSKYMELVDILQLGNDRGIYIVKAPQGLLMLGFSSKGIDLLEKLGADETELIYEAESTYSYRDTSFGVHLNKFLNNINGSSAQGKNGDAE